MKLKNYALVLAIFSLWSNSIWADLANAQRATAAKDFQRAVALLTPLAEKGDAIAQFNLGYLYYSGQGVTKKNRAAIELYSKAAGQDYAPARTNLGVMFQYGQGVEEDEAKAIALFDAAAEQGY